MPDLTSNNCHLRSWRPTASFSAEQDFKYASETFLQVRLTYHATFPRERIASCINMQPAWHALFLAAAHELLMQVQARRWLAKMLQQPLPDFPLALLLENGFIL